MNMTKQELAKRIDHTLLKPEASRDQVLALCREAREYGFASVCVNPMYVPVAVEELAGSDVLVCTVAGFPLGANATEVKASEARIAVAEGAKEIDMVLCIGALKSGENDHVEADIRGVVDAAQGVVVKVIIETCYLTDEEKIAACQLARSAGAHFVKTSTGLGPAGATPADVRLMRRTVGDSMRVKAAGGVRTLDDAIAMIEAGADRIGASAGVAIVAALDT
jgi:deoxyribose-phosphate aldolase